MKTRKRFLTVGLIAAVVLLLGCSTLDVLAPGPSVCESDEGPSLLCVMAEKNGVKLEAVANALIIANAIMIGEGVYSRAQAIEVLSDLLTILERPVSYRYFRLELLNALDKYPGLILVANSYINQFTMPQIMFKRDRGYIQWILRNQIEVLSL